MLILLSSAFLLGMYVGIEKKSKEMENRIPEIEYRIPDSSSEEITE